MGNTETLLSSRGGGGPCCCAGLATAKWSYWVGLGEAPSLARGTPCTLLCPSSALFSSFLLKRCFISAPHPAQVPGGCQGGWH